MGLGRTRLSIRPDSAFHLGKWPKTRIFRNFELRRIRKAFCPASPKIILELGLEFLGLASHPFAEASVPGAILG